MYLAPEGTTGGGYGVLSDALVDLEHVYAFVFARVGNRPDAEDVVQQVALKALPRLRQGASDGEVRAYLFATARSVLATFWSARFRIPESEMAEDVADDERRGVGPVPSTATSRKLEEALATLPPKYRQVLELRFLRGYTSREVAREIGSTEGAVKVMQLRALRAAAAPTLPSRSRPARRRPAAAPGSASAPPLAIPASAAPPR